MKDKPPTEATISPNNLNKKKQNTTKDPDPSSEITMKERPV